MGWHNWRKANSLYLLHLTLLLVFAAIASISAACLLGMSIREGEDILHYATMSSAAPNTSISQLIQYDIERRLSAPMIQVEDQPIKFILWSPDRSLIAYVIGSGYMVTGDLWLLDMTTYNQTLIAEDLFVDDAAWSPDGTKLVFQSYDSRLDRHGMYLVELETRTYKKFTDHAPNEYPQFGHWSEDGQHVYFHLVRRDGTRWIQPYSVEIVDGGWGTVECLKTIHEGQTVARWSPDGSYFLHYSRYDDHLYIQVGTDNYRRLSRYRGGQDWVTWSPNGQQIAFVTWVNWSGEDHVINLVNRDGTNYRELYSSNTGVSFRNLAWSPDGSRLVYVLEDYLYYRSTLHEINIATGIKRDLVVGMEQIGVAAWSPEGDYLTFSSWSESLGWDIFLLPSNSRTPINITNRPSDEPYFVWKPG